MELIEALKRKQGSLSQRCFAAKLGLSYSMLSLIYSGNRVIGEATVRRIIKAYPDLLWLATGYLMTKDDGEVA